MVLDTIVIAVEASLLSDEVATGLECVRWWLNEVQFLCLTQEGVDAAGGAQSQGWTQVAFEAGRLHAAITDACRGNTVFLLVPQHSPVTDLPPYVHLLTVESAHTLTEIRGALFCSMAEAARADSQGKLCVVGAVMKDARHKSLCKQGILHLHEIEGVVYVPLYVDCSLSRQARVDVVLVKATDFLKEAAGATGAVFSEPLSKLVSDLESSGVPVIDPLQRLEVVADRGRLRDEIKDVSKATQGRVQLSRAAHVSSADANDALEAATRLPGDALLVKKLVACGPHSSHEMALVLDKSKLHTVVGAEAVVVESFMNHGGVQYKCYAVKGEAFVTSKASIPDVKLDDAQGSNFFCGTQRMKCDMPFVYKFHSLDSMPVDPKQEVPEAIDLDSAVVQECAKFIASKLNLTLFGFDLIISNGQNVLFDVNAFPSYKGFPRAATLIRSCMKQALER